MFDKTKTDGVKKMNKIYSKEIDVTAENIILTVERIAEQCRKSQSQVWEDINIAISNLITTI